MVDKMLTSSASIRQDDRVIVLFGGDGDLVIDIMSHGVHPENIVVLDVIPLKSTLIEAGVKSIVADPNDLPNRFGRWNYYDKILVASGMEAIQPTNDFILSAWSLLKGGGVLSWSQNNTPPSSGLYPLGLTLCFEEEDTTTCYSIGTRGASKSYWMGEAAVKKWVNPLSCTVTKTGARTYFRCQK